MRFLPVAIMIVAGAGLGSIAFAQGSAPAGLPPGPEAEFVGKTCTACHVASQFTSQRKTKEQWAETVNTMIGYGAQVSDAQFDQVVGYLAKNFPAEAK